MSACAPTTDIRAKNEEMRNKEKQAAKEGKREAYRRSDLDTHSCFNEGMLNVLAFNAKFFERLRRQ